MPTIHFTSQLERFTDAPTVTVSGATLSAALDEVFERFPQLRGYIVDDQGAVRRHVAIFIDGRQIADRENLSDPTAAGSEIYVFPSAIGRIGEYAMNDHFYTATRKGLFVIAKTKGRWEIADAHFLGDPVSAVLATDGRIYAALDTGHFGAKLWMKEGRADWRELPAPAFPKKPDDLDDDPHPWTVEKIWNINPGGVAGRLWIGTMAGGLFRSDDNGETWTVNEPFWTMPERRKWMGVAGGERPGLSTVLIDPDDPAKLTVGVSCAGVWASDDTGSTWRNIGAGFDNQYMPPDQRHDPIAQDIHQLAMCPASPNVIWCQHHSAIYRSTDGGENWTSLPAAQPSGFGFAVVAHPTDPETAWFVPAIKDEQRFPVDAKLVVSRTTDGGRSFDVLAHGLPQHHAYDLVYRHALAVDGTGATLAFGSTSGGLWVSEDGGESWSTPEARLPPVAAVEFEQ